MTVLYRAESVCRKLAFLGKVLLAYAFSFPDALNCVPDIHMSVVYLGKSLSISGIETPIALRIRGRLFSMLCCNNILIIWVLSSLGKLQRNIAMISLTFVLIFIFIFYY